MCCSHYLLSTFPFIFTVANPVFIDPKHKVSYHGFTPSPRDEAFLGIPYGKDASGVGQFAPPQPLCPPVGYIFNVTVVGPPCPQVSGGFLCGSRITDISEDCLNLKVLRPADIEKGRR